jgi:hypothetical protein
MLMFDGAIISGGSIIGIKLALLMELCCMFDLSHSFSM